MEVSEVGVGSCERLEFSRDRVVDFALGWGHLVVATATQCFVYSVSNWNTPHMFDIKVRAGGVGHQDVPTCRAGGRTGAQRARHGISRCAEALSVVVAVTFMFYFFKLLTCHLKDDEIQTTSPEKTDTLHTTVPPTPPFPLPFPLRMFSLNRIWCK